MLRLILAVPLLVVLVVFLISNQQRVAVNFLGWNTEVPQWVAVLLPAAVFFLVGALVVWVAELRQRRRARRAETRVRELETVLAEAHARVAPTPVAVAPKGALAPGAALPTGVLPP